ncbi:hypothetical protein ACLOJK_014217 [Asimina triloba]
MLHQCNIIFPQRGKPSRTPPLQPSLPPRAATIGCPSADQSRSAEPRRRFDPDHTVDTPDNQLRSVESPKKSVVAFFSISNEKNPSATCSLLLLQIQRSASIHRRRRRHQQHAFIRTPSINATPSCHRSGHKPILASSSSAPTNRAASFKHGPPWPFIRHPWPFGLGHPIFSFTGTDRPDLASTAPRLQPKLHPRSISAVHRSILISSRPNIVTPNLCHTMTLPIKTNDSSDNNLL